MDPLPAELKIERQSLAYEVAKQLSRLIEEGNLPPGTRLIEIELAKQMGVSRGPLREALRILEATGLVENVHGRGSYVASLSRDDARELYALRILLEQEAARLAALHCSPEQIESLKNIYSSLLHAADLNDYSSLAGEDLRFHQMIWDISGNKRLKQVLVGMLKQIRRYMSLQTHLYQSPMVGVMDHGEIFAAIERHDPTAAAQAMRSHLQSATEVAVQNVPESIQEVR